MSNAVDHGVSGHGGSATGGTTDVVLRRVNVGPSTEPLDYETGWQMQCELHDAVVAGNARPTVLLLQHSPVYTAGRRTEPLDRPFDGTPVVDVNRGGKITWHGPGQLVAYPIVPIPNLAVVDFVRSLETAIVGACVDLGLVSAMRVRGRSGVWVPEDERGPERKVAAIGVRVASRVTMHGLAINCDCDLSWFDRIVPCGIRDAGVTSLSAELGRQVSVDEALPALEEHLMRVLGAAR